MSSPKLIISAAWVVPVTSPVIANGAVVVDGEKIVAVDSLEAIRYTFPGVTEKQCSGVLMPGLVNCHIHLELSHLGLIKRPEPGQPMTAWIDALLVAREKSQATVEKVVEVAENILQQQYETGVYALADISGRGLVFNTDNINGTKVISLMEYLAPTLAVEKFVLDQLSTLDSSVRATGHAPYSTTPHVLQELKKRARAAGELFSIHLGETAGEIKFLRDGEGPFRDFFEEHQIWDDSFVPSGRELNGAIEYADRLGLLDENTLCVHCVHTTEKELKIIRDRGAHICLCPGSNRYLRTGKASVENILAQGLHPGLGTDSLASNETVDMWREMLILREEHPQITPDSVLEMATLGGAEALGISDTAGRLEKGCTSRFLQVNSRELTEAENPDAVVDILSGAGCPETVEWLIA